MNTEHSVPSLPDDALRPETPAAPAPGNRFLRWLKCLLAGNPFYLASAALLLYGISHVANGARLANEEENQLLFNLTSLGLYEVMLVGTVLLLTARCIWYDAALLVWLENLFLFVPFILISQASLIGGDLVWATCLSASALVIGKIGLLRWRVVLLNYPPRLLALGALLLLANLTLALQYRRLIEDDAFAWKPLSSVVWLTVLPALQLLVCALPRPRFWGGFSMHQSAVPFVAATVWIAATATHVAAVDYVDDLVFRWPALAPLLWVFGWTLFRRVNDFVENPSPMLRNGLVCVPFLAVPVAGGDLQMVFMLSAMSAVIYGVIHLRESEVAMARHGAALSGAVALFTVPAGWLNTWAMDRWDWVMLCFAVPVFAIILLSRNPRLGLVGGFGLVMAVTKFKLLPYEPAFMTVQCAFAFVLLHSLRWEEKMHRGSNAVRAMLCGCWVLHTVTLGQDLHPHAEAEMQLLAWGVFAFCGVLRLLMGQWPALVLPLASVTVLCANPLLDFKRQFGALSTDTLAIAGSFALFGLGTALALTKHRWLRQEPGAADKP